MCATSSGAAWWSSTSRRSRSPLPTPGTWFGRRASGGPILARPPKTLVNEAEFQGAQLSGRFLGTLDTPDTRWYHQYLDLDLRLRGHVLNGAIMAYADYWDKEGGAAPGKRGGNALSFWAALEKIGVAHHRGAFATTAPHASFRGTIAA